MTDKQQEYVRLAKLLDNNKSYDDTSSDEIDKRMVELWLSFNHKETEEVRAKLRKIG